MAADEPQDAEFSESLDDEEPTEPQTDEDMTPVDRLAWALAESDARDQLEVRLGARINKSSYVATWPGVYIFDLEQRMRAKLPEGTYTVLVRRESNARVIRSAQISVLAVLEPDEVTAPAAVADDEDRPMQRARDDDRPSVERLALDIQREALEHLRAAAANGTPAAYEAMRRESYQEGYERGAADVRDPDSVTGWSVLLKGLETVRDLGQAFLGGDFSLPDDDDAKKTEGDS